MKEITSLGNAVVKDVCNLKQKKYRERSGSFVVEGLRAVEEAVRYAAVQKLFAVPDATNTRLVQLLAASNGNSLCDKAFSLCRRAKCARALQRNGTGYEKNERHGSAAGCFGGVQQAAGFYSGRRYCACA